MKQVARPKEEKMKPAHACMYSLQENTYFYVRTTYEYRVYTLPGNTEEFQPREGSRIRREKTEYLVRTCGFSDWFKVGQNQLKARQSRKKQLRAYLGLFEPKSVTMSAWAIAGLLGCALSLVREKNDQSENCGHEIPFSLRHALRVVKHISEKKPKMGTYPGRRFDPFIGTQNIALGKRLGDLPSDWPAPDRTYLLLAPRSKVRSPAASH